MVAGAVAAFARRLTKKSARMLDNAPFKFAPADGVGYLEKLGWVTADVESVLLAANQFHRLSRLMRLVTYVPQPNPRKLGNMPWNAVIRLSHWMSSSTNRRLDTSWARSVLGQSAPALAFGG